MARSRKRARLLWYAAAVLGFATPLCLAGSVRAQESPPGPLRLLDCPAPTCVTAPPQKIIVNLPPPQVVVNQPGPCVQPTCHTHCHPLARLFHHRCCAPCCPQPQVMAAPAQQSFAMFAMAPMAMPTMTVMPVGMMGFGGFGFGGMGMMPMGFGGMGFGGMGMGAGGMGFGGMGAGGMGMMGAGGVMAAGGVGGGAGGTGGGATNNLIDSLAEMTMIKMAARDLDNRATMALAERMVQSMRVMMTLQAAAMTAMAGDRAGATTANGTGTGTTAGAAPTSADLASRLNELNELARQIGELQKRSNPAPQNR